MYNMLRHIYIMLTGKLHTARTRNDFAVCVGGNLIRVFCVYACVLLLWVSAVGLCRPASVRLSARSIHITCVISPGYPPICLILHPLRTSVRFRRFRSIQTFFPVRYMCTLHIMTCLTGRVVYIYGTAGAGGLSRLQVRPHKQLACLPTSPLYRFHGKL